MKIGAAAAGAAGCVVAWSANRARTLEVSPLEERVFRAFNRAPDLAHPLIWPVMQSGSLAAVGVAAAAQHLRQGHGTGAVAGSGVGVWLAAKVLKDHVRRGRPQHLLGDVRIRGCPQSGLGFPSGHAAVSVALALSCGSSRNTIAGGLLVAGVAGGGRMYDGAHLPLDVVGGWALGVVVGVTARTLQTR